MQSPLHAKGIPLLQTRRLKDMKWGTNESSSDGLLALQAAFSTRSDNRNISPFPHLPTFQFYALKYRSTCIHAAFLSLLPLYTVQSKMDFKKKWNLKEINKEVSDAPSSSAKAKDSDTQSSSTLHRKRGTQQIKQSK